MHIRGSVETGGLKGTHERWTTSRGQLHMTIDIADLFHQESTFDGEKAWVLDSSGMAHELSNGTLEGVVSAAYEASHSFLLPGRLSGRVDVLGEDVAEDAYTVRLEPDGGTPVTVSLDRATFLPKQETIRTPTGLRTTMFSGWREFSGVKLPSVFRQSTGDHKFDLVVTIEQVEINERFAPALFEKPEEAAAPIHFAGSAHEVMSPVEVYSEYVFIPVRVSGAEVGWFLLDSGANESVISKPWAERIGLASQGALGTEGAAGSTEVGLAKNLTLGLPGVEVPTRTVAVEDLSWVQQVLGRRLDGLLGYDFISRFVIRVDYQHRKLTLYDPVTFKPAERGTAFPLTFFGNVPRVAARITIPGRTPINAQCLIDSGAGGFALAAPFVEANRVLESVRKTIATSVSGAGGGSKALTGRIEGLQLGPYILRRPITTFSQEDTKGLLASPDVSALIGGRILSRFTVTFDYPHQRILLEPNTRFGDSFRADGSGLSLLAGGADFRRFEIDQVEPGSPASAVGLRKGDVITAIDGHPVSDFDLAKVEETFRQSGRAVRLTIDRAGKALNVSLKLEERI